ncbi:TrkH family potassium uptake protein [Roseobacter sp. HKCCA0434]|uniref:TrkH family potassium uptake protein n=1 Tax=Roseobacter sp. HKCCA0434 TaxID=3079297 RepID=UPI002905CC86|nr:potassium transporter TrkG [Roseobacter sp. HKCCA0434]
MLPWHRLPLFIYLLAGSGAVMLVTSVLGYMLDDHDSARPFFYGAWLTFFLCALFGLALANRRGRVTARSHLLTLMGAYLVLPVWLMLPLIAVVPTLTPMVAYFEAISALTTTGATVFDRPESVPVTVHLYRGLVAWSGGFLILLAAVAIMLPLNIGGFEVQAVITGRKRATARNHLAMADAGERLSRAASIVAPVYVTLTAALMILLMLMGQGPVKAGMTAMAVLSTSGILPVSNVSAAGGSAGAEIAMALFLLIGATAIVYDPRRRMSVEQVGRDPELRLLIAICLILPGALFLRHWIGALELDGSGQSVNQVVLAIRAAWGALFTVLSFLTTFGLESAYWDDAQRWSGLPTPGILLMGLSMIGGGVATTAGGVKLLRIYALYRHGERELRRLTLPHSVGGAGATARRIRTQGAFIAWIFLMLFLATLAVTMLALTAAGLPFEEALRAGTASLTNTGPGYLILHDAPRRYADFAPVVHMILAGAMVLGRLETLALIALLNPGFWRS